MATTTMLELIFSGLLLLSLPEGDGKAVVVFPEDSGHQLDVVLLKGKANCAGLIVAETNSYASADAEVSEAGAASCNCIGSIAGEMSIEYPSGSGTLRRTSGAVEEPVPDSVEEAAYLSWVPRLSEMIVGTSRLRSSCDDREQDCFWARARFFLDRGEISSCHLVHELGHKEVQLYRVGSGEARALADTIKVTEEVDGGSVTLNVEGRRCRIDASDNGEITLFVANTPTNPPHPTATADRESHFRLLHRFHRNFLQRMDRSRPQKGALHELDEWDYIGSCEQSIIQAQDLIEDSRSSQENPVFVTIVHSPSECGTATQP